MEDDVLVSVRDLRTYFYTNKRCNKAVDGVSFSIRRGRTLCVVGESGCGKSVTAASVMQLLPTLARIESGEILYRRGREEIRIDRLPRNGPEMRALRGAELAMIFQDPMTALNPVYSVGFQIMENLQYHRAMSSPERRKKAISLLGDMGIPLPEQRVDEYPHQFSGGMRQRAMIAMAMACEPKILIADEPTTALDVTTQAQVFGLMNGLKEKFGMAVMLITHDMGVVTELADEVIVMYMGNVVEAGPVDQVLRRPGHPYTEALLKSIPILGKGRRQTLNPIRGATPDPYERPRGCRFAPRCDERSPVCDERMPGEAILEDGRRVRCWMRGKAAIDG